MQIRTIAIAWISAGHSYNLGAIGTMHRSILNCDRDQGASRIFVPSIEVLHHGINGRIIKHKSCG